MRCAFRLLLFSCAALAFPAFAQNFDMQRDRMPLAELKGQFRFHAGDDPRWTDPTLDDSSWSLLKSDQSWYLQGYNNYSGVGWYRFRVNVPAGTRNLAIFIPFLANSYEIFANGRPVGKIGEFPPHASVVFARNEIFLIPPGSIEKNQSVTFAIRVWVWPLPKGRMGAGFGAPPILGNAELVARWRDLQIHDVFWTAATAEFGLIINIACILLGFALFAVRPAEREYFWFGVANVFWALFSASSIALLFLRTWYDVGEVAFVLGYCGGSFFYLVFFHSLLRRPPRLLFWTVSVILLIPVLLDWTMIAGLTSYDVFATIESLAFVPYTIAVALLLYSSGRQGNREAWLLFVPFTALSILIVYLSFYGAIFSRNAAFVSFEHRIENLITWPVHVDLASIIGNACPLTVGLVLILRFARTRRDEERMSAELEAARTVQQVLVPNELPSIPCFQIKSVYKPAGQVGGDFFQILPTNNGGVLAVIGDVSGKGLPAAMTVSLLVGTLRTLAHYTQSPAEILAAMNQRMLGRSQGGFTTCLVARADADGRLTVANAGHVAPYIDGREVELDSGLPLGISADAAYMETTVMLQAGSQLTLLTDGVVEARSAAGELFGFERTAQIAHSPAESIARMAREFGQDDDITVLTLSLAPADVLA